MKQRVLLLLFLPWAILTGMGQASYLGNTFIYIMFSSIAALMWGAAWVGTKSYFYIFISTFWLLGFWMKTCVHVAFGLDYGEPIGAFDGSAAAWDHALLVSSLAMFTAFLFRLGQMYFLNNRRGYSDVQISLAFVPCWYARYASWVWAFSLLLILCVAVANFKWGIFQIGLMPNILPFKLNALTAAAFNLIFPIWLATLIWWDVCLRKPFMFRFIGAVFEAVLGSVSILSRGAYVYHTLHYLVSSCLNRNVLQLSWRVYAALFIIVGVGVVSTSLLTTSLRSHIYSHAVDSPGNKNSIAQEEIIQHQGVRTSVVAPAVIPDDLAKYKVQQQKVIWHKDVYQVMMGKGLSDASSRMITLLVDRWVGLEGVLAVSSYNRTGAGLFVNGWLERPSISTKVVFNYIANSIYVDPENKSAETFLFSSIPGLVAMLYYSGSYSVVFVGVMLFLLFVGLVEYIIFIVTRNPFVTSFFAIYMANLIAQFGSLHQVMIQVVEMIIVIGFITVLQAYKSGNDKYPPSV